jgi:hypothetical protein
MASPGCPADVPDGHGLVFNRPLAYLSVAAAAAGSAMFQSRLFAGDASAVISPRDILGFIAPDQSIAGILR